MASYDGSIRINTRVDTTGFDKGCGSMVTSLKKIGALAAAAFSVGKLVQFGKQAVELASDLQEVQNVVDTAFGSMSYKMEDFADTAIETYGISKLAAKQTGSTMMAMASGMGIAMDEASDMAISLTALSADMASFYNVSQDLASIALKSVFTGETETLKQYGIVMTEANLTAFALEQGLTKAYSKMSQAEKVMLRYNYVMNTTKLAQGDFAKTSDSWANQTRILQMQWQSLLSVLGSGLVTVLTPVVRSLNSMVGAMITLANTAGQFLSSFFGIETQSMAVSSATSEAAESTEEAAEAMDNYATATANASKAAKKGLSSFDELNNLTSTSSSSGSGSGTGGTSATEISTAANETTNKVAEASAQFEALKGVLNDLWGDFSTGFTSEWQKMNIDKRVADLKKSLSNIGESIKGIFTDSAVVGAFTSMIKAWSNSLGSIMADMAAVGINVAGGIIGGVEQYFSEHSGDVKQYLIDMFNISSEVAVIKAQFASALAEISKAFTSEGFKGTVSNVIGIFSTMYMQSSKLFAKLGRDYLLLVTTPIKNNSITIKNTLQGLFTFTESITGTIEKMVTATFTGLNKLYDEHFKPFIDNISSGLSDILAVFLSTFNENFGPLLDSLAADVDDLWVNYLSPLGSNVSELLGNIIDLLSTLWKNILAPLIEFMIANFMPKITTVLTAFKNIVVTQIKTIITVISDIVTVLSGVIELITALCKGDWKKAWESLKKIAVGLVTTMKDIIVGVFENIKTTITNLASPVTKAWSNMWNSMKSTVKTVVNYIIDKLNNMIEGINKVNFTVPDWVPALGGTHVGFNIPTIPKLANGGITTGSTLAQIGEAGREAVLPLEQNTAWMDSLADKLASKINSSVSISLEGDARGLFELVQKQDNSYRNMTGHSAFVY